MIYWNYSYSYTYRYTWYVSRPVVYVRWTSCC